jgi:hypothetical protein
MNTEVAQLIALVCHSNAALRGVPAPAFALDHSTAKQCALIRFSRLDYAINAIDYETAMENESANTPIEWMLDLMALKRRGLRLCYEKTSALALPDHARSALQPGGGNWLIEVVTRAGVSEFWAPRWEVTDRPRLDGRVWDVNYLCLGHDAPNDDWDATDSAADLRSVLVDLDAFARENDADVFADAFESALVELDGAIYRPVPYSDLAPPGLLSHAQEGLLRAMQTAWVFGGADSWSDLRFKGETAARYDELSDRLWRALIAAALESTNSSYYPSVRTMAA